MGHEQGGGGGAGAVVKAACFYGQSVIVCSSHPLEFKFQRNKMFLTRSLVKNQYRGEPP